MKEKPVKELKGMGGRDAASYKSETGGIKGAAKKMDKLASSCGTECKGKDASAYKNAKLQSY